MNDSYSQILSGWSDLQQTSDGRLYNNMSQLSNQFYEASQGFQEYTESIKNIQDMFEEKV